MKKTSSMTFRLDDLTPDMDWDRFYRIKAIFDKYHVRPLLGVVPDNKDDNLKKGTFRADFWEVMRSLKDSGWEIAMHGTWHSFETKNSGLLGLKKASEFAGLPLRVQMDKIIAGRNILKMNGIETTIFMAPGHTYDKKTLKALKKCGFTCVSDGYMDVPCRHRGLLFIPCRRSEPLLSTGTDTICICPNELRDSDFRDIELFLEKHHNKVVPFREVISQLWYPRKGIILTIGERRNLLREKIKRRYIKSEKLKRYITDTYDPDPSKKLRNRLRQMPGLIFAKKRRRNF